MGIYDLHRFRMFFLLVLVQVLVLNYVQLFSCASPLLYIYFIIQLPRGVKKWQLYLWGFFLGLSIDVFMNTPGVATIASTTSAALRPYILEPFLTVEAKAEVDPSIKIMGFQKYMSYVGTFTLLYCTIFFTLDYFTFWHFGLWLLSIVASFVLTLLTIGAVSMAYQRK